MVTQISCPYCVGDFSAPSESLLMNHIRLVHSFDPGFSIQCSSDNCSRTFTSFKAYQNHRRLKHSTVETIDSNSVAESDQTAPMDGPEADGDDQSSANTPLDIPTTETMQAFASTWILKTRETRSLTRTAMQWVIADVGDLVTFVTGTLEAQTRAILRSNGCDPGMMSALWARGSVAHM